MPATVSCLKQHICSCQHPCHQKKKPHETLSPLCLEICTLHAMEGPLLVPAITGHSLFTYQRDNKSICVCIAVNQHVRHKQHRLVAMDLRGQTYLSLNKRELRSSSTVHALSFKTHSHQVNTVTGRSLPPATQTPVKPDETYTRHLSCLSTFQPADGASSEAVPLVAGPLPTPSHCALWLHRKRLQDWAHDEQTWRICG